MGLVGVSCLSSLSESVSPLTHTHTHTHTHTNTHTHSHQISTSLFPPRRPPSSVTMGIWTQDLGRAGAEPRVASQTYQSPATLCSVLCAAQKAGLLSTWLWSVWTAPRVRGWGCVGVGQGLPGCGEAPRRRTQGQLHLSCRSGTQKEIGDREPRESHKQIIMLQPERPR